jgi:predicted ArsR family transcriptional regulator
MQEHSKNARSTSGSGRTAVLDALRAFDAPVSIRQLADHLGLHTNTVRFHLTKLVQAGLAQEELAAVSGPGRPRLCYRPTPTQAEKQTPGVAGEWPRDGDEVDGDFTEYRLLSQILAGYLAATSDDPAAAAASAGRQWGRYLVERPPPFDQLDNREVMARVTTMLDNLGFRPEPSGAGEIQLHHCPFRDVAERQPGVVCSIHLGLIQGAVAEIGTPGTSARLDPFVTERLCVAHLDLPPEPPMAGGRGDAAQPGSDPTPSADGATPA